MIRKIPENSSEGVHFLFCKVHKFKNQLIITINDLMIIITIKIIIVIMIVIIVMIVVVLSLIIIIMKKYFTANSQGLASKLV